MTAEITYEILRGESDVNDISDLVSLALEDHDGLGMPPLHYNTDRSPNQHGVTVLNFRLDPRIIKLRLRALPADYEEYWTLRSQLLRVFRPKLPAQSLRITLPDGSVRQVDILYNGGLGFSTDEAPGLAQAAVVELFCPDPILYDPEQVVVTFDLGGGADAFNVPTEVPTGVGASTLDQVKTITYSGSWITEPIIEIVGPLDDPIITHVETGEVLDFTGVSLGAGESRVIDCRFGRKTVVDETGTDKLLELSDDSDLGTFVIYPDDDLPGGVNNLHVAGTNANEATTVYVRYYNRYIGS